MKQTPNVSYSKESSKSLIIWNTNQIQEHIQFNSTKYKTGIQKTYASVVQGTNNTNTNVNITDKSNNTNAESEFQTLLNKLKTLHRNKRPQNGGKLPSGSTSKTRQESSPRDKEIENLKNEILILKQS